MNTKAKIQTYYEKACAVIRIVGEICNEGIFELCDEVDLAVNYYQYKKIEIQIDSLGGDIQSLEYFISKLNEWRRRHVVIATLGLMTVASAAAMILSLGDVGYRRAYKLTKLLFHNARILPNNTMQFTKENLSRLNSGLNELDEWLLDTLATHVFISNSKDGKTFRGELWGVQYGPQASAYVERIQTPSEISCSILKTEYGKLNMLDKYIDPMVAQKMYLIDSLQEDFEARGFDKKFKRGI